MYVYFQLFTRLVVTWRTLQQPLTLHCYSVFSPSTTRYCYDQTCVCTCLGLSSNYFLVSQDTLNYVRSCMPSQSFSEMIDILKKLVSFMNMTVSLFDISMELCKVMIYISCRVLQLVLIQSDILSNIQKVCSHFYYSIDTTITMIIIKIIHSTSCNINFVCF